MTTHWASIDATRPEWLGGGQWMLRGLSDVTMIFARNGMGKSLLLRAIAESDAYAVTHYASPERGGDIAYNQAMNERELKVEGRGNTRRGKNFAAEYRQESISRVGTLLTKLGHSAGAGSLESSSADTFGQMTQSLKRLMPGFDFAIIDSPPFVEISRLDSEGNRSPVPSVNQLSSGEAEVLSLALDLLTMCHIWDLEGHRQKLILMDEPDPHMHPDLIARFARFLGELVQQFECQLILATHNTGLLAATAQVAHLQVSICYLNNSAYEQIVHPADKTVRRLTAILGGHALLGPLTAAPILLVEGDDDYEIWSVVPRHPGNRYAFSVLAANGDEIVGHQKVLEALFGALRDDHTVPAGFALLDGDKGLPTHVPTEHVPFIQLACHEAENLYLSDQVLGRLDTTWSDLREKLRTRAADYGALSQRLLELTDCEDRFQVDLKGLMVPIAELADEKRVPWTMRVGQTLGAGRPQGDLVDLLGSDVMAALWPT